MSRYKYIALDKKGARQRGELEAASVTEARTLLAERALLPMKIEAARSGQMQVRSKGQLTAERLADVLEDLAALLLAGVPLAHALSVLSEGASDAGSRGVIEQASVRLRSGRDLSTILSSIGDGTSFLEGLVRVGQLSGDLGMALRHAAQVMRRDEEIRRELWAAMSYPLFVLIALFGGFFVILGFVIPALAPLVAELPAGQGVFLKIMVAASEFMLAAALPLSVAGSIVCILALLLAVQGALQRIIARFLATGPMRRTVAELEFGAWAVGAGRLIAAGAPAPQAALGACTFVRNQFLRAQLATLAEGMRSGATLATVLAALPATPPALERMARIGERAGGLGPMLERAGEQAQSRAVRRIRQTGAFTAPIALLVMGALIGSMIGGLLSGVAAIGEATLQ